MNTIGREKKGLCTHTLLHVVGTFSIGHIQIQLNIAYLHHINVSALSSLQ